MPFVTSGNKDPQVLAWEIWARKQELHLGDPWSWAELDPDEEDYARLRQCAEDNGGKLVACLYWADHGPGTVAVPQQQVQRAMGGLLTACLLAEIARREATESDLWGPVAAGAPKPLRCLFDHGNPTHALRVALRQTRYLGMRSAFDTDGDGQQTWVTTLRLQYGFSHHGVQEGLLRWLDTGNVPRAVRLLRGDGDTALASESFKALWSALCALRYGTGNAAAAKQVIRRSPWLLTAWRDEVLALVGPRRTGGPSPGPSHAKPTTPSEPVKLTRPPGLLWQVPNPPCVALELADLSALRLPSSPGQASVHLQDKDCGCCLLQQGAGYRVEGCLPDLPLDSCTTGEVSIDVVAGDQRVWVEVWPLWDSEEPFTLFDLATGKRVADPDASLGAAAPYAILAAPDVEVTRDDWPVHDLTDGWRFHYVPPDKIGQVEVRFAGQSLWRAAVAAPPAWVDDILVAAAGEHPRQLADPLDVAVEHPANVEVCAATWRAQPLECLPDGAGRTLLHGAEVRPGPWGGKLSVRLTVARGDEQATIGRLVALPRVGLSIKHGAEWVAVGDELDLGRHNLCLALFHTPPLTPPAEHWRLREGDRELDLVLDRPALLMGLRGAGEQLVLQEVRYDGRLGASYTLADWVVDRGLLTDVAPEPGSGAWVLRFRRPVPFTDNHAVWWWDCDGALRQLEAEARGEDWVVTPPTPTNSPRAVALCFKGKRLGAVWLDDWAEHLPEGLAPQDGLQAMARMGVPLLDPAARERVYPWLWPRLAELAGDLENLEDAAKHLVRGALESWSPGSATARRLLLSETKRLADLCRSQPSVVKAVVSEAVRHKLPLPSQYWDALAWLACNLAGLSCDDWPKAGRANKTRTLLLIKEKTSKAAKPWTSAIEALDALSHAIDTLH